MHASKTAAVSETRSQTWTAPAPQARWYRSFCCTTLGSQVTMIMSRAMRMKWAM